MTDRLCERLDDYLLNELPKDDRDFFAEHLTGCETCRGAVQQQRRIDDLLKAGTEAIPCPPGFSERIHAQIDTRKRPRSAAGSLALAALAIGLLGWLLIFANPGLDKSDEDHANNNDPKERQRISKPAPPPQAAELAKQKAPPVRVEFPPDVLPLTIDSGEPDITLIQVFPVKSVSENR